MPRTMCSGHFTLDDSILSPSGIQTKQRFSFKSPKSRAILVPASILLAVILWDVIVRLGNLPAFILPSPGRVWMRMWQTIENGSLLENVLFTLGEVLAGLGLGVLVSTSLGYLLAKSIVIERILSPYIIASQSVPIIAIAPLLVIWFGPGPLSKILICALIVFFPVLVNTVVGLRTVPEDLHDLMRSLQSSHWQTFRYLEIPAAMPVFLGGLKIGATLSVIGAVVGEFIGANHGLGFLINQARGRYDTAMVFVAVLTLVALAMSLYGSVVLLERRFLSWNENPDEFHQTLEK
jgi:NitT/TauT family transport system permease protein